MEEILMNLKQAAIEYAPSIGAALLILVVGWLVAIVLSFAIRSLLNRTQFHKRMAGWFADDGEANVPDVPRTAGRATFWVVILLTVLAVSQTLDLTLAAGPLSGLTSQLFEYLPKVFGAALLLLLAWIIAKVVRLVVTKTLIATGVDKRFSKEDDSNFGKEHAISKSVGETLYWLVFLLFLPAILGALQLEGILEPIQSMLDGFLAFIPNIIGAMLIVFVGWFVARIVRSIVSNLISATGGDTIAAKYGIKSMSQIVGLTVYTLILIPIGIGALNALQLEAITAPASDMLSQVLNALPNIFGATLVVIIAVIIGRFLSRVVSRFSAGVGVDNLPAKLGFKQSQTVGGRKLSDVFGIAVFALIMLFATFEAASLLGFEALSMIVSELTVFAGKVGLGLVILVLGVYLSNIVATAVSSSALKNSQALALIARVTVLAIVGSMAIRQMGIADDIVNLAFGLSLGAVAVAAAIAFGIGGRDLAAKKLAAWSDSKQGGNTV